jgi:hypothetical protein
MKLFSSKPHKYGNAQIWCVTFSNLTINSLFLIAWGFSVQIVKKAGWQMLGKHLSNDRHKYFKSTQFLVNHFLRTPNYTF